MRVLIMADMEGVAGITVWSQVTDGSYRYEEGRRLYTEEINAAIRGAKAAGATEIVAVDCHGAGGDGTFNSLLPEWLDEACEYVVHHPWGRYTDMFTTGCDACLLIGMHARAGTVDGVLAHTISSVKWRNLWFNDDLVGETGVNAALCGHFNVPVVFVSGDQATCREARSLLGERLTTVPVKQGLSTSSARHIPARRARVMIEEGVTRALTQTDRPQPYVPGSPVTIRAEVNTVDKLTEFKNRPGVEVDMARLTIVSRRPLAGSLGPHLASGVTGTLLTR